MELYKHNQKTVDQVITCINKKQNCCVVNDCGTGKSQIMAEIIKLYPDKTFLVITQQANAADYLRDFSDVFKQENVLIITYSKMVFDFKKGKLQNYKKDFYLIDEAHYVGAPERSKAFFALAKAFKPYLIGFTATPQRFEDQGSDKTVVTQFFSGNSVGNVTAKSLAEQGLMIEPDYFLSIWNMNTIIETKIQQVLDTDIDDDKKQEYLQKLDDVLKEWRKTSHPQKILKTIVPKYLYKPKNNRVLVYVSNLDDLRIKRTALSKYFKTAFPDKVIKEYEYTYRSSEQEFKDFQQDDEATDIKILYSVNKVMETIHFDDLYIVIMLRPSVSKRIITQQFGRVNSLKNKFKTVIIDMVDNLNNLREIEHRDPSQNHYSHTGFSYATPCISRTANIFNAIDNAVSGIQYTYCGFSGSLQEVCYVFCKDYVDAKQQAKKYMYIEDIMEHTVSLKNTASIKYLDDKIVSDDFTLTDEQRKLAKNTLVYDHFIERRRIEDEDLKQILYLAFLRTLAMHNQNIPLSCQIHSSLTRAYLRYMRKKYIESVFLTSLDDEDVVSGEFITEDDILDEMEKQEMISDIQKELECVRAVCGPRDYEMFLKHFGFDDGRFKTYTELASFYKISRGRVGQIINRRLMRLRHPCYRLFVKWKNYGGI